MKIPRLDLWTGKTSIDLPAASAYELKQLKRFVMVATTACIPAFFIGVWALASMTPVAVALMAISVALFAMLSCTYDNYSAHSDHQALVLTRLVRDGLLQETGVAFIREVADIQRPLTISEASQLIELAVGERSKRQREELYATSKSFKPTSVLLPEGSL